MTTSEYDVVLIDLGSVFWAAWHASVNEAVSTARNNSLARVRALANGHKAVAVCCDSQQSWRRELDPSYKANRPEKDKQALDELQRTEEALSREGFLCWKVNGFEADDVMATAALEALGQGMRVLVHSADKDLVQLVRDEEEGDARGSIVVCSTRDGRYYREKDVLDKFGVRPSQMRDWLALVGDSSDNVKGVPGVGPKKASDMLRKLGTVEAAIAALTTTRADDVGGNAVQKALAESLEQLAIAQKLVTLRTDVPLDFGEIFATRATLPANDAPVDAGAIDGDDESDLDAVFGEQPMEPAKEEPKTQEVPPKILTPPRPAETTALAVSPTSFEMQLEPTSAKGAMVLAEWLSNSRLYTRFPNQEAIFAVIVRGREMGLGALTALDCFHVIEGKPALHAHLIIARTKALPECEYFRFVKGDATFAEYETKHRDDPEPTRLRYTFGEAENAGITRSQKGRTNWEKRPAEMLRKTCAVQLARIVYPEAALGLYSVEELEVA